MQEEIFFINLKYQELKTKHAELLKSYISIEEKNEEIHPSISLKNEKEETDSIDNNFKTNETFDFSPYGFQRTKTIIKKPTKFANSHALVIKQMKTSSDIIIQNESYKDGLENDEALSKKEFNADILEKDSCLNNTSVLTNSDISKTKLEISENFKDSSIRSIHIDINLVKHEKTPEEVTNIITSSPPIEESFSHKYF